LQEKLLERRREMLRMRSKGLSLNVVVNDLSQKYDRTREALYKDWRRRKAWIKALLDLGDPEAVFLDILARHEDIYRMTVMECLQADNSSAKIGALRLLRDLNRDFYDMNLTPEIMERLDRIEEVASKR